MLDLVTDLNAWASLATLAVLEIVLGIDNLIFISILADKLSHEERQRARRLGLMAALGTRLILLASIAWVVTLTEPFVILAGLALSWRDIILFGGGLFLLGKGTIEIHHNVEGEEGKQVGRAHASFGLVILQIALLDIVFSLDSVITAVGMSDHLVIMVAAVVLAMGVMLFAARPVGDFVARHPTVKMLALSFLLLIGVALVADGLHFHIPKGYLYFAVAFSILVEALNLWAAARRKARRAVYAAPRPDGDA